MKPNILFLVIDSLRADKFSKEKKTLPCYIIRKEVLNTLTKTKNCFT